MICAFTGYLHAGPACNSCAGVESCSDSYTEKSCSDDSCADTDADHKHEEKSCPDDSCATTDADHKHEEKSGKEESKAVNTDEFKALIDSGVPLIILDARSGKYDDGKRIPGSLSLNAESKSEEIAKILPNKEALVVTYCANLKCPASSALYNHLKSLGYSNLIEYPEGIQGWIEAGNPIKSVK